MQRLNLLTYILLFFQTVFAQEYQSVERYSLAQGLPSNSITDLHVDSKGFLWIATSDGMSYFDGYKFHNYFASIHDTNSLPNDNIRKFFEDSQGDLWVLTPAGLSRYETALSGFTTHYFPQITTPPNIPDRIKDAVLDQESGTFYLLLNNRVTAFRIKDKSRRVHASIEEQLGEEFRELHSINYLPEGRKLLLGSSTSALIFDVYNDSLQNRITFPQAGEKGKVKFIFKSPNEYFAFSAQTIWHLNDVESSAELLYAGKKIPDKEIVDVQFLNDSIMQIVDQNAIIMYNWRTKQTISEYLYRIRNVSPGKITGYAEMPCGVFWIGSTRGLFKFTEHNNAFRIHNIKEITGSDAEVRAVKYDTDHKLWFGLNNGELFRINNDDEIRIEQRYSLEGSIHNLALGSNGEMWIATSKGLYEKKSTSQGRIRKHLDGNITCILPFSNDSILVAMREQVFWYHPARGDSSQIPALEFFEDPFVIEIRAHNKLIYLLQKQQLIEYDLENNKIQKIKTVSPDRNSLPTNNTFVIKNGSRALIGTSDGIYEYYLGRSTVRPIQWNTAIGNQHIHSFFIDSENTNWFTTNNGLFSTDRAESRVRKYGSADGLWPGEYTDRLVTETSDGKFCFGGANEIVIFEPQRLPVINCNPLVQILDVRLSGKKGVITKQLIDTDTLWIDSRYRHFKFTFAALDYWNPEENKLQYMLTRTGRKGEWTPLNNQNFMLVSNLRAGMYTLKVDGTNHEGLLLNSPRELVLIIDTPFWQSRLAIGLYIVFLVLFFYMSIYWRTQHLQKLNREYKERERIAKKIEQQKEELTVQNKNITDSINYAKRIQMALMPSRKLFAKYFPDSFILHIPKDIVSGDFYWINEVDGRIYFAAVDCTGHGVPGAFMSIIGFDLFRRITEIEKKKQPAEVLNSLSSGFETIFRDVESITLRDGMDVAFCAVDPEQKVLEFAGAFNPLYLVRDNTITEIKGDRFSVGLNHEENVLVNKFSNHVVQLQEGDIIYIFTDGFADQFGGPEGKKYKYRRFRHLLLALHQLPMDRQVEFLQRSILDWKGDLDQVDDILVMGIRILQNGKFQVQK